MAKEAAVLRWMVFRQRRFSLSVVAGFAVFFSLFFGKAEVFVVNVVVGQLDCRLRRGAQEKVKDAAANG